MPLPDERPRGSVANLIGRFETQVKRQSSSSPASARSLSATSHVSGDSAKEEAKERHEWPPKSASPDVKAPITISSSSFARSLALAQAVSAEATLGIAATQAEVMEAASLTPRPRSTTSNSDKPNPVVTTPPQQQFSIDIIPSTLITSGTPMTAKPPTTAKLPPAKTEATGKPSIMTYGRTPVNSTGARPFANPAAQPIKFQNTGPSNLSSSSRKPVAKPTPPSANVARSAAARTSARPKTPSSMQSRTLSSGLFAPTAASLAKSRNAQQPPFPTSTKKTTMSSAIAERLSKPTAASLSRTRTTTAASTKSTASASSARTPATKSKTSTTGTLTKKTGTITTAKKAVGAAVGAATTAIATVTEREPVSELPQTEIGHQTNEDHVDEHPEDALNLEKQSFEQENSAHGDSHKANAELVATDQHLNGNAVEDANNATDVVSHDKLESHDTPLEQSEKAEPTPVNGDYVATDVKPGAHVGNEIEDMVNLLESVSVSKVRPESITTIPDEE